MNDEAKIPTPAIETPRCPLCHGRFERQRNEMVAQRLEFLVAKAVAEAKQADSDNDRKKRDKLGRWIDLLDASIKAGAAEVFACHFCRIGIAANDPFVDRWEMVYAEVGKENCISCETPMRFFCTSTGVGILDCPNKACRARIKRWLPDRAKTDPGKVLFDEQGNEIALPNVDNAVSTPGDVAESQVTGPGKQEGLPDITNLKLPPMEGKA